MANEIVKYFPAVVKPIIQFCLDNEINIIQMPCPETLCMSGGLDRKPHGKKWYEANGLREISTTIAKQQATYMRDLTNNGFTILAVIGVEFSPACAVTYLNKGRSIHKDKGIYVEELEKALEAVGLDIKFIGISQRWQKKMVVDLNNILKSHHEK
jgi:predicted secreted protein